MSFAFRKWYFDLLTDREDYVFVYFAYARFLGMITRSMALHLAEPGGDQRTISFSVADHEEQHDNASGLTILFPEGKIVAGSCGGSIALGRNDNRVDLDFAASNQFSRPATTIAANGKAAISWTPLALRYRVSGDIRFAGRLLRVRDADGYADLVESSYLPPLVPVRTLYWGRLHHPDVDCAYVHALNAGGAVVRSKLYVETDRQVRESIPGPFEGPGSGFPIDPARPFPLAYTLGARMENEEVRVKVHCGPEVQRAAFLEQQEMKSRAARYLLRTVTRNPRSIKYLSRADVTLGEGERTRTIEGARLIHELARI